MKCKKCKIEMVEGQALVDKLHGIPDFIESNQICTVSPSGDVVMVKCLKCPECGYSVTKGNG